MATWVSYRMAWAICITWIGVPSVAGVTKAEAATKPMCYKANVTGDVIGMPKKLAVFGGSG